MACGLYPIALGEHQLGQVEVGFDQDYLLGVAPMAAEVVAVGPAGVRLPTTVDIAAVLAELDTGRAAG